MSHKYTSIILLILVQFLYSECEIGLLKIGERCYNKKHIDVLQDFIDLNAGLLGLSPEEIGYQEWTNNQLTYLYLGNNNIEVLPDSIGLLKSLIKMDLRDNQIQSLPEGICEIYPFYADINFTNNKICPEYPYCIDYLGKQDISECENVDCPLKYIKIDGKCYNKEHIQILQSIINTNSSLKNYEPLDIGSEIGQLQWENGDIIHLNMVGHELTTLPESLCAIYKKLEFFDVSNNAICPPYPYCFDFIGFQNIDDCVENINIVKYDSAHHVVDNKNRIQMGEYSDISLENFQFSVSVLQEFINKNESLANLNPLEIGSQKWVDMRLIYLDLSGLGITYIPAKFCDIYPHLSFFNFDNNAICPPFPQCLDYIGNQSTEPCGGYLCPDNYIEKSGDCYYKEHFDFINNLISINPSLSDSSLGFNFLASESDNFEKVQLWHNGKLDRLILSGLSLVNVPDNICNIYNSISTLEISNNKICPPYPNCFNFVGYQDLTNCMSTSQPELNCSKGHIEFDGTCYFYKDFSVLLDIIKTNPHLISHHPILLGYQLWENGRLISLGLDGWNIEKIPDSIDRLEGLKNLNLNNNSLSELPLSFCDIYTNLNNLEIDNNYLCPPYLDCFDYIGQQNLAQCDTLYCPYNYEEINDECYFKRDIDVLREIIKQNPSLQNFNVLDVGIQKWENMHLDYLYLGAAGLQHIPDSICDLVDDLINLNISKNKICPPYPDCIDFLIGEQDTSVCP